MRLHAVGVTDVVKKDLKILGRMKGAKCVERSIIDMLQLLKRGGNRKTLSATFLMVNAC